MAGHELGIRIHVAGFKSRLLLAIVPRPPNFQLRLGASFMTLLPRKTRFALSMKADMISTYEPREGLSSQVVLYKYLRIHPLSYLFYSIIVYFRVIREFASPSNCILYTTVVG